jgi:GNAT superfamily N-acetyltransferase
MTFSLRPLDEHDTEAALALCGDAFAWGDYIPGVWDRWLREPAGRVTGAFFDDTLAGFAHLALATPDEAIIEGVRVAPAARGQGIGTVLVKHALRQATELGAAVVRGTTETINLAMQAVFHAAGFVQIGAHIRFEASSASAVPDSRSAALIRRPDAAETDRLWAWLEHSNIAPLLGGTYLEGSWPLGLTDVAVERFVAAREVWLLEDFGEIQAMMLAGPHSRSDDETRFVIRYLDGQAQAIGQLALFLRARAAAMGLAMVDAQAPDVLIVHDALNGAGFTRFDEHPYLIYAREISPE